MINISDISVVIQGPIIHKYDLTKKVIESVKNNLVGSEIIISTWENENTNDLDVDYIIKNIDPGGILINESFLNNVNRQIVSTIEGIKVSKRKFILKLRSDTVLINTMFLDLYTKYCKYDTEKKYRLFYNKILTTQYFCRDPFKSKYLFHISDILLFGYKQDVYSLYDCKIAQESDLVNFYDNSKIYKKIRNTPEQYLWLSLLNKKDIFANINYLDEIGYCNFLLSEYTILNNFIIINSDQFKVKFPHRFYTSSIQNLYSFSFWRLYTKLNYKSSLILSSIRFLLLAIKLNVVKAYRFISDWLNFKN